jgi:cathepsin B
MKFLLFLVALAFCYYDLEEPFVCNYELIDKINNNPSSSWVAGVNAVFAGKKFSEIKNMLGAKLTLAPRIPKTSSYSGVELPDSFDTYTQWPSCVHAMRDQANCGSCWAFSAAEAMSDRFCIQGKDVILSPQDFVSCESDQYACEGGYLSREWAYMEKTGIVTDECFPYVSGGGVVPKCPTKCPGKGTWTKYKAKSGSTINFADMESAMENMYEKGSMQAGFTVYQDFFSYKSGVYVHTSTSVAGGHAVKNQGWGVDSKTQKKYWNMANSWGTSWGMKGYFWILRGTDECGIEDDLWIADPLL